MINSFVYMRAITKKLEKIIDVENIIMATLLCVSGSTKLLTWPEGGVMAGPFKISSNDAPCCFASEAIIVRSCNQCQWVRRLLVSSEDKIEKIECEQLNRSKADHKRRQERSFPYRLAGEP